MSPFTSFRRFLEPVAESWAYHVTTFRHGLRTILPCRRPLNSHADPIRVHYGPRRSVGFKRPITCPLWPCTTDHIGFPKPAQHPYSLYWYVNLILPWDPTKVSCDLNRNPHFLMLFRRVGVPYSQWLNVEHVKFQT